MNGTTTCSYYATLHLEASKLLVDIVREQGQRAYVGKVSMDRNSPVRALGRVGREKGGLVLS
jgi:guanine deaminase